MSDTFRTLIVTASDAPLARIVAATLSPAGVGMWVTPLAPTSDDAPTHYISTGWISPEFADMVPCVTWQQDEDGAWVEVGRDDGNAVMVYMGCVAGGLDVTQAEIDGLFLRSDVSEQEPWTALTRLGLVMVQESMVHEVMT
jgi:hypothetical protein